MKEINEIIGKYMAGTIGTEAANAELEALGTELRLDPERNAIKPEDAGKYGLLDTGTGTLDKVEIQEGKLLGGGVGEMYALCFFGGKLYHVEGDLLVDASSASVASE